MGGFNAARSVTDLDYDFTKYGGPKSTVPEPNDQQIAHFSKAMSEFSLKWDLNVDPTNPRKVAEAAAKLSEDDYMGAGIEQAVLHGELCSNNPSADDLMKLPPRVRNAFYGWLQESFSPEV